MPQHLEKCRCHAADTRNREENPTLEGFREEVAYEQGLEAHVGF